MLSEVSYCTSSSEPDCRSEPPFLPRMMEQMRKVKISGKPLIMMIMERKHGFRMLAMPQQLVRAGRARAQGGVAVMEMHFLDTQGLRISAAGRGGFPREDCSEVGLSQ